MAVTDEQVIRERLDLEMLERPHLWPTVLRGMVCVYVKQRGDLGGRRRSGPCFRHDDGSYTVMSHDWEVEEAIPKVESYHYNSAEAVLAGGWIVD